MRSLVLFMIIEVMQKKMINTARNWGYDDGKEEGKK